MIDFYISMLPGVKASLIITSFLMISTFIIGLKVRRMKAADVPKGITLIAIMFVEGVNGMQRDFFKKYWKQFTPFTMTVLLYLMFANTASLWGLTAPLSNITVALSFSIFAFGSVQVAALFTKKPKQRAKDLLEPHWAFFLINLVGEMSTPFAMGLRLFGNLLSGAIIGIILYGILSWGGIIAGAFILHPIFDMFFGLVQAYVYFMLLTIFLSMAVED
jgi:F-type H+-transporting ATPase subunit a